MSAKRLRQQAARARKKKGTKRTPAATNSQWSTSSPFSTPSQSASFLHSGTLGDLDAVITQMQSEGIPHSDIGEILARMSVAGHPSEETTQLLHQIMDHGEQLPPADQSGEDFSSARLVDAAATPAKEKVANPATNKSTFLELTSEQLLSETAPPQWLLPGVLIRNEPAVIVGPSKSMKTSIAVDLCKALASGGNFLGQVAAEQAFRVGFVSAEGERQMLGELARRCSKTAQGDSKKRSNLFWALTLDKGTGAEKLSNLRDWIARHQLEVVVIDPQQLTAARGAAQATQLRGLVRCCLEAGATPIVCCLTRKSLPLRPMDVSDMPNAGCQDFARQWFLVNRRRQYEPGSGQHHLWLTYGGNAGHGGIWGVDIEEGAYAVPASRKWSVTLHQRESLQDEAAEREAITLIQKLRARIRVAFHHLQPEKATKSKIREQSGISGTKFGPMWEQMLKQGEIVMTPPGLQQQNGINASYYLSDRCRERSPVAGRMSDEAPRDISATSS